MWYTKLIPYIMVLLLVIFGVHAVGWGNVEAGWNMDTAGATQTDETGNGHTATRAGDPSTVNGKLANANILDGSGDYWSATATSGNSLETVLESSFSIELWINTTDSTVADFLWFKKSASDGFIQVLFNYPTTGKVKFYRGSGTDGDALDSSTATLNNGSWIHLVFTYNDSSAEQKIYVNGVEDASRTAVAGTSTDTDFFIGANNGASGDIVAAIDEFRVWDIPLSDDNVSDVYNSSKGCFFNGLACPTPPPAPAGELNLTLPSINNTAPFANDSINVSIYASAEDNVSAYIFAWDNGTGTLVNESVVFLPDGTSAVNISKVKNIDSSAGAVIQYQWWANDTQGVTAQTEIFTVTVAGNVSPGISINPKNFFLANNKTLISLADSRNALLNFTLTDDIDLFAYEINITNSSGDLIYNETNVSLSGLFENISKVIDVSGPQGYYNVSITVTDSHTAKRIKKWDVSRGLSLNSLLFDGSVTIEADGAIFSNSKYKGDRYEFSFNYLPFSNSVKVFHVRSTGKLVYRPDSGYKGHLVDFQNKKWIDFEGIEGNPLVEKIDDHHFKITISKSGSSIQFQSIGGLNRNVFYYSYYLSNPSILLVDPPTTSQNTFENNIINVAVNVTGNGRNQTRFMLYNSTALVETQFINNTGNGTATYKTNFSSLTGNIYYVNISHYDRVGSIINTSVVNFFNLLLTTDTTIGYPAINFTVIDELNGSRVRADLAGSFTWNGTVKTDTLNIDETNIDNLTINLFPAYETIVADYTLTYEANEYPQRKIIISDVSLTNVTQTRTLYLLHVNDGILALFRVVDADSSPLSGVTIKYTDAGDTVIIEQKQTDDSGSVSFWVDPDQSYDFTFSKSGYVTASFTLTITDTDVRTVTLQSTATTVTTSYETGISYYFTPTPQILNNNTNYTFNFNMTSSFWNVTACTLRISNASEELAQFAGTTNGSVCDIGGIFNTGNQSLITSTAEWQLNGSVNTSDFVNYKVQYIYEGSFSLKNAIDDLNAFTGAGFNATTKFLLAFIILVAIVGGFAAMSTAFREPEILIILAVVIVFFFSYVGWFQLTIANPPAIKVLNPTFLNKWFLFMTTLLGGGAYIVRKHII